MNCNEIFIHDIFLMIQGVELNSAEVFKFTNLLTFRLLINQILHPQIRECIVTAEVSVLTIEQLNDNYKLSSSSILTISEASSARLESRLSTGYKISKYPEMNFYTQ